MFVPEDIETEVPTKERFPLGLNRDPNSSYGRGTFLLDNWICIGFNGADPAFTPDDRDITRLRPHLLKLPHLQSNQLPYAPFILRNPQYDNEEFLKRLKIPHGSTFHVEVVDENGVVWYQMEPRRRQSWVRLQDAIVSTVAVIRSNYDCCFNISFCAPRLPETYGFTGSYRSLPELRRKVLDSRDAFNILFAYGEYFISGVPTTTSTSSTKPAVKLVKNLDGRAFGKADVTEISLPTWARVAIEKYKIHPAWIHMMLFSEVHNFNRKRVGCYIKVEDCEFLHAVPCMLRRNIPLVFMWPLDNPRYGEKALWELPDRFSQLVQPTQEERKVLSESFRSIQDSPMPVIRLTTPSKLRAAREETVSQGPSKPFGVGICVGSDDDDDDDDADDTWGSDGDLANRGRSDKESTPTADDADEQTMPAENIPSLVKIENVPNEIKDFGAWGDFIAEGVNPHSELDVQHILARAEASAPATRLLEIVLRDRYGFRPVDSQTGERPPLLDSKFTDKTFFKTRIILSDTKSRVPENPQWKLDVQTFTTHVTKSYSSKGPLPTELGAFCDLVRWHPNYSWRTQSTTLVRPVLFRLQESEAKLFELSVAGEEDPGWRLFIRDATTAVECMRTSYASSHEIAATLLERGTSFSTCAPNRSVTESTTTETGLYEVPFLGWRSVGYKPDFGDFCVYEAHLRHFLRLPRARAVWKLGGLCWRIACYFADGEDWSETVLRGPSDDPGSSILEFHPVEGHDTLIDDGLSIEEIGLVIGRYRVYTGMGKQYSDSSWWPHPTVFQGSFLDVGYWAPACETWFQNRLSTFESGKFDLKTSSEWRSALHQRGEAARFVKGHAQISSSYIEANEKVGDVAAAQSTASCTNRWTEAC